MMDYPHLENILQSNIPHFDHHNSPFRFSFLGNGDKFIITKVDGIDAVLDENHNTLVPLKSTKMFITVINCLSSFTSPIGLNDISSLGSSYPIFYYET